MKLTTSKATVYHTLVMNEEEAAKLKGILGGLTSEGVDPLEELFDQFTDAGVPDTYELRYKKFGTGRNLKVRAYLVKLEEEDA
jgi:hypothetical protein